MRIVGRIGGDLKDMLSRPLDEIADAARAAVQSASEALQADLRAQVAAAGLGHGLEKAWRMQLYPHGRTRSFRPAGLVWSKATRLHDAFERGEPVAAGSGRWLAVPLQAAVDAGFARRPGRPGGQGRGSSTPAKWSNIAAATERFGPLRFVPINGGARALLVADGKVRGDRLGRGKAGRAASIPLFLLVRRVRGRKLLDIAGAAQRAEARLAANLSNILGRA